MAVDIRICLITMIYIIYDTSWIKPSHCSGVASDLTHNDTSGEVLDDWKVDKTTRTFLDFNTTTKTTLSQTSLMNSNSSHLVNVTEAWPDYMEWCPSGVVCSRLSADCINCEFTNSCHYGQNISVTCHAKPAISCVGERNFTRWFLCRYCYQTAAEYHRCTSAVGCRVAAAPLQKYEANCTVKPDILCLGRRRFYKMMPCNWTSGRRWSTALILSITFGGFGADRFYLGLWREGIGKLFSFGGLGVWPLIDVVLVATGYIGPADGSLYI